MAGIKLSFDYLPRYLLRWGDVCESVQFSLRVKNDSDETIKLWPYEWLVRWKGIRVWAEERAGTGVDKTWGVMFDFMGTKWGPTVELLDLRPGTSYRYPPRPHTKLLPFQFGPALREPGEYSLLAKLLLPDPFGTVTTKGKTRARLICFEQDKLVWEHVEEPRPNKLVGIPYFGVMKYRMPDGIWLFYVSKDQEGRLSGLDRLAPVREDDEVRVMFDPVVRPYEMTFCCDYPIRVDKSKQQNDMTHVLVGQPGRSGVYLVVGFLTGSPVYERRLVKDFGKAKLERQPDGRVVLVEEK